MIKWINKHVAFLGLSCSRMVHKCVGVCVFGLKVAQTTIAGAGHSLIRQTRHVNMCPRGTKARQMSTRNVCCGNEAQLSCPHSAGQMVIFPPHPFFLSLISQGQYKSLKVTFKTSLPLSTNSFAIISAKQDIFSHRLCISPIYFRKLHCSKNKRAGRRFKN